MCQDSSWKVRDEKWGNLSKCPLCSCKGLSFSLCAAERCHCSRVWDAALRGSELVCGLQPCTGRSSTPFLSREPIQKASFTDNESTKYLFTSFEDLTLPFWHSPTETQLNSAVFMRRSSHDQDKAPDRF